MIWSVWWIWVVAGLLLGIVEILVPGFVFLASPWARWPSDF